MGTPEFPDLGKHCTVQHCKLIDFLPFTCDRCNQIYCLDHRTYTNHQCSKSDKKDIAVVVCPLCAKGVRLNPDEDPNITWEQHVNTDCDPSNYEKITKKKKCPVPGCREVLTFSNTIKCKDCSLDHCLKHRFGQDHKCAGPKKPDSSFSFMSAFSRKEASKPSQTASSSSSSKWGSVFFTNVYASTEAGMTKLGNEFNRAVQMAKDGIGQSSGGNGGSRGTQIEECPQCGAKFASVTDLVEHVEQVHEDRARNNGVVEVMTDVCPKCSREFHDAVSLVEHVERDHCRKSKT